MDRMPIRLHPSISDFLAKPIGSSITNHRFSPNIGEEEEEEGLGRGFSLHDKLELNVDAGGY